MSETLYESEILKSLEALDNILTKSHHGAGKKWPADQPKDWAGTKGEKEDDERDNVPDGTDYKAIKKAQGYDAREDESLGMRDGADDKKKQDDKDRRDEMRAMESDDEVDKGYGHKMSKGVEVSEFLNALTKSIAVYCADLEDFVIKSISQVHEENGAMSKAIAENLVVLNDIVVKSQGNIAEYAEGPARGPKSMLDMSKSVSGPEGPELSKSVVLDALMKGVEAGTVSPLEVIKAEQYGVQAVNQDVVKSLLA
jgi:hypothetical protein